MSDTGVANWREIVERHRNALMDDLASHLDAEIHAAVDKAVLAERQIAAERIETAKREATDKAVERTRRSVAEALNQNLRRFRHIPAQAQVYQLLVDASAPYAACSALAVVDGDVLRLVASRGLTPTTGDASEPAFDTASAAALAAAIETRDPVVALATAAELSEELAALLRTGDSSVDDPEKAYIFPVLCRADVEAVLIATGGVLAAPLELLCEAAGLKIEALVPEVHAALVPLKSAEMAHMAAALMPAMDPPPVQAAAAPADLVQITVVPASSEPAAAQPIQEPSDAPASAPARRSWDQLTPEEQRLHLKAQRVARVKVAEIRLYHSAVLGRGNFIGDIYGLLHAEIDAARQDFLHSFLSKSATMVDYLHLEILRSLANDDERLLGSEYPGPMV
jgi:hypothetical protein